MEDASRGWFEDDEAFEVRLEICRKKKVPGTTATKSKGGKKPATAASKSAPVASWVTPGGVAAKQAALGKKSKEKAKAKGAGGVFAAMMMDSDSD